MTSHLFLHFILAEITASHLYLRHTKERLSLFVLDWIFGYEIPSQAGWFTSRITRVDIEQMEVYLINTAYSLSFEQKKSGYLEELKV